jgi:uncharacterized protein YegL
MSFNHFTPAKPRPMPVFLLADTSGSMNGEKIQSLNTALRDMIAALRQVDDIRGEVHIALITFGGQVNLLQPLAPVTEVSIPELTAGGQTPMGSAFDMVRELVEDQSVVPHKAYLATIVLVSDGIPTDVPADLYQKAVENQATEDDFRAWTPLQLLQLSQRVSKCQRLAMGIGSDQLDPMLRAFNTPGMPVIKAKDAAGIERFFRWITMSVSARSVNHDPNLPTIGALDEFEDDEVVM